MARLTKSQRDALPARAFALPKYREFPLTDRRGRLDEGHLMAAIPRIKGSAKGLTRAEKHRALQRVHEGLAKVHRCKACRHVRRGKKKTRRRTGSWW